MIDIVAHFWPMVAIFFSVFVWSMAWVEDLSDDVLRSDLNDYLMITVFVGCDPLPVTVGPHKSLEEFPNKHVIILVVTVTGKGPHHKFSSKASLFVPSLAQISRPEGLVYSIHGRQLEIASLVPKIKGFLRTKENNQRIRLIFRKKLPCINFYEPFEISMKGRRGVGLVNA